MEVIFTFLLSSNFALLCTALLAVLSAYLKFREGKSNEVVKMLMTGIELAGNPETKKVIKELAEAHEKIKTVDFEKQVNIVTAEIKNKAIQSIPAALSIVKLNVVEKGIKFLMNLKK